MVRDKISRESVLLAVGDLLAYLFSLIATLIVRYGQVPSRSLLEIHIQSFGLLFIIFLITNLAAGLYDTRSALRRKQGTSALIVAQFINAIIGVLFFYFVPASIAPKENLLIFFIISTLLLFLWRRIMFPVLSATKSERAILIGSGDDVNEFFEEINGNARYSLHFEELIVPSGSAEAIKATVSAALGRTKASVIVADLHNPAIEAAMPLLYSLVFSGIKIIDCGLLYESMFGRIPLSMAGERWLVENSETALRSRRTYDLLKRVMDIVAASILGIISLVFYPFVYLAIKMDDGGPIFVAQQRIGKNGTLIKILKFRSMTADDSGNYGTETQNSKLKNSAFASPSRNASEEQGNASFFALRASEDKSADKQNLSVKIETEDNSNASEIAKTKLKVTRVGKFIRLTRIDELPQLWSVLTGEQSLIGPRPELPALTSLYEKEIPYYNARHLITPGLSGWAQIYGRHAHHGVGFDETRNKLSYDLYYVKNRSLALDIRIALQTLRALVSRQGV